MSPPLHALPSVRPPQLLLPAGETSTSASSITSSETPPQPQPVVSLLEIQTRLQDAQSSLASHVDKIHALETILAQQETLKREMRVLRDMMESRERELTAQRVQETDREKDDHPSRKPRSTFGDDDNDNDDDAWSMATVTVRGLERVDEEDEEGLEQENQQQLEEAEQVRVVLAVKSALEAQHIAAQVTIRALEGKVEALEAAIKSMQEQSPPPLSVQPPLILSLNEPKESITKILSEWKMSVQGQWSSIQEEWSQERERLNRAREEFEVKTRQVKEGLKKISNLESTVNEVQQAQSTQGHWLMTLQTWMTRIHDGIRHGMSSRLVTPPSPPRGQSSDSARYRRRRSPGGTKTADVDTDKGSSRESSAGDREEVKSELRKKGIEHQPATPASSPTFIVSLLHISIIVYALHLCIRA